MNILSKVLDRVELHVLNKASHFVFAEYPIEAARLINGFVQA